MRSASTRPQVVTGLVLVAAAVLCLPHPHARADEPATPKPAKKDSSPRIRPPEVTLTPSVTPAEARAGETVTYQVTAKLDPGWHIYTYAKKSRDNGPRNTTFDIFDTAGLEIVGDWTASKPPIRQKEPAFPQLPFLEFYEGEVTWNVTLRIPPGTEPGKKTLRCQAGYQICNAQSCKIPGQWTLPEVTLTVLPGDAGASAAPAPTPASTAKAIETATATAPTPTPIPESVTPTPGPRTVPGANRRRSVPPPVTSVVESAPVYRSVVTPVDTPIRQPANPLRSMDQIRERALRESTEALAEIPFPRSSRHHPSAHRKQPAPSVCFRGGGAAMRLPISPTSLIRVE